MRRLVTSCTLAAGIASLALACADHPVGLQNGAATSSRPSFGESTPFNGAGQCLGNDAVTWKEFVPGLETVTSPNDLNCTANDIGVTSIVATQMLINGVWVSLGPDNPITCTEGSVISLRLVATLDDAAAAERFDVGLWIGTDGGNAISGSCNHYNLPVNPLPAGVSNVDSDSCGDMIASTTNVDLGELTLVCHGNANGKLEVPSCVAWSSAADQRVCPVAAVGGADGFRAGTLPGTVAKCNCQPVEISIPTGATGTITIVKDAVPNDPQDFAFTTTGTGLADFSLDDDADATLLDQHSFTGLAPGTYTVTETATAGFDLTALNCTAGGAANIGTRTVTVTVSEGTNVTCTFSNTKRATVQLNKRENGTLPLTRAWAFEIRNAASTSAAGTIVATGSAILATGVVDFSCSPDPNPLCANVGGVARFVPASLQLCEANMPMGWSNNISGFTPFGSAPEGSDNATECINVSLAAGASGVPSGVPDPINNVPPAASGGSIALQTGTFTLIGGQTSDALSGNFSIRNSSSGTQEVLVTSLAIVDATFRDGPNLVQATISGCVFSPPLPVLIPAGGSQEFTLAGCQVTPSVRKELMFTIRATINAGDQLFYDRTYKVRTQ